MKHYSANVLIAGDRNAVITKHNLSTPEVLVLQAIHGSSSVIDVAPSDTTGIDRTPKQQTFDTLMKKYRKTKVGSSDSRTPVLVSVFPGWPNVTLPTDLKDTHFSEAFMVSGKDAKLSAAQRAALDEAARITREKEAADAKAEADYQAKVEAEEKAKLEAEEEAKLEAEKDKQASPKSGSKAKSGAPKDSGDDFLE